MSWNSEHSYISAICCFLKNADNVWFSLSKLFSRSSSAFCYLIGYLLIHISKNKNICGLFYCCNLYRDMRDGIRRKNIYPHYTRDRSPHKRDSAYFRESPVGRRDSPHSRSGSSVSSRSYSPDRSKAYAFHQSQHGRSVSSLHKRNISQGNIGLIKKTCTSQIKLTYFIYKDHEVYILLGI